MSQQFTVLGISPIVAVADPHASVDFYVRHLGFKPLYVAADRTYAVAGIGDDQIHFLRSDIPEALAATANHCMIRIRVQGLDLFWQQIQATQPPTRIVPPEVKPWGVRELHILDPDHALVILSEEPA